MPREERHQVLKAADRVDTTAIPPEQMHNPESDEYEGIVRQTLAEMAEADKKTAEVTYVKPKKVVGLKNADAGINPKDRVGASKVDLTLIPPTAKIHCALALMDGATKYGPYNWRMEPIQARTYIAAIMRHCEDYLDSEESARDSGILHMGHIMASAAILLDAGMQGTLIDDRPIVPKPSATASVQLEAAHDWIKKNKEPGWGR